MHIQVLSMHGTFWQMILLRAKGFIAILVYNHKMRHRQAKDIDSAIGSAMTASTSIETDPKKRYFSG